MRITAGATNKSVYFYIVGDASHASPGDPITGLLFSDIETGGSASYVRQGAARVDLTLITLASASAAHDDGGFIEVDATHLPGVYRCDYPDAPWVTGVDQVICQLVAAAANNAAIAPILVDITAVLNNLSAAQVNSEADTALSDFFTSPGTLVDLFWDEVITKAAHDVANSAAKILRHSGDITQIDGSVSDATPLITGFDTNLTQADTYFDDAVMVFANGAANAGIGRPVVSYLNANGAVTFMAPDDWPVTPVNGDDFIIYATHVHPISQIRDAILADSTAFNGADIAAILADTGTTLPATLATIAGYLDTEIAAIVAAVITNAAGADVAADIIAIKAVVDGILTDTASGGIVKNAAFNNFEFPMVLTSDHYTAATLKTVTGEMSLDGAAFVAINGTIAEVSDGIYQINLTADDTNADTLTYKFSATDCDDTVTPTIITRS